MEQPKRIELMTYALRDSPAFDGGLRLVSSRTGDLPYGPRLEMAGDGWRRLFGGTTGAPLDALMAVAMRVGWASYSGDAARSAAHRSWKLLRMASSAVLSGCLPNPCSPRNGRSTAAVGCPRWLSGW